VAFVTNNASDFWKIAQAGTEKAIKELGCEVIFRIPSTGTAQEQQTIVQDLVTVGVSGIAISPKDPANQTAMLNRAAAAVNLITQDSDAPESNRACYIGTNNYQAGVAAGELIKKTFPNGGKIMLFVGTLDAQNAQDRKKGIEDTLQGSSIEIVDTRTDETDRVKAKANAQDALVTHPDLACLVGLWSYNGPSILSGVRDSGQVGQVKIICFDEEEEALQGVKDGYIAGTIVQQPFEFGYQSVKMLVALAKGDRSVIPANKQLFIPVKTITRENVDEFWTQLKQLTGKT
jgi:ribose transport system substrate-binding protein